MTNDQSQKSEVWEINVNSPARTINNNLGSDFTSNSNRLHWSGTLLVLRRRIDHHWKGPSLSRLILVIRQFAEDSRSESNGTVYSRERSGGGKMTQRRAYFVTRSDAAHEWWIHSFCPQSIAWTAPHNSHKDPDNPLVFEIKRIIE